MSVASKVVAVMNKVGYMKKDGKVQGGASYAYLSEEKITSELHAACAEVGLVVMPLNMVVLDEREDTTRSGNVMRTVTIGATYRFIDPDEPETPMDAQVLGQGSDTGDKVINKCMTAAFKYALRQTFMISTGDDPDKEASVPAESSKPANRQPKSNGANGKCSAEQAGRIKLLRAAVFGDMTEPANKTASAKFTTKVLGAEVALKDMTSADADKLIQALIDKQPKEEKVQ